MLLFWLVCAKTLLAQPAKSFRLEGGRYTLTQVCEWLNQEQQLNISFNHNEKALQKEVVVAGGTYTFERLFQQYFRPQHLDYKVLGAQIIIFAAKVIADKRSVIDHFTLNGYVTDSASGERLQGATIAILDKEVGTISNNYGFYSLTLPEGTHSVVVNVVGYEPILASIELQQDTALAFRLTPVSTALSAVTVTAAGAGSMKMPIQNSTQMSMIDMPIESIESMPKLLGETDVFRSLQFLPGVNSGNEVSSGLYIRGGSPDQNLILLDGVPVYNASHLFGLFSVFNSDALQSVQLYKGGFPARYGGRLSSVVDIRMKEGNKNAWHGEGGIGLIASRFTLEGPLSKGRSSIMMSGRITNWGPLMKWLSRSTSDPQYKTEVSYEFYDLNLKANFYLAKNDHLYISGYFGRDRLNSDEGYSSISSSEYRKNEYDMGLNWGNATAVVRWNHQFNKKMFSNTTVHFSRYQYFLFSDDKSWAANTNEYSRYYQKNSSDLKDIAVKYDLDIVPNPNHYIRTGLSATRHHFIPGIFHNIAEDKVEKTDTIISGGKTISGEYDIYVEDDIRLSERWKANLGAHGTGFKVGQKFYTSLQPRLSARYLINKALSVKGAFVYMNQFIHLLSNSGIGLPTDLWVPVTERIPPQKSLQFTLGAAYTSPANIELSVEGYYKTMNNVLEYEEGATFTNTTINWEQRVEVGDSKSRGIEFLAQKKKGRTTGLLSYTLSKTDRTFSNINEGRTFPYRYDRRHDIKLAVSHKLSERKELNFDWVFGSGQAVTVPIETYVDQNGETVTIYTERNSFRMPVYHRADLSISFNKQKRRWLRTWTLGVYNVYGRQNPLFISLNSSDITRVTGLRQLSVMPFPIPSVSYQIKF
jgi:hypothetical protein